jgi:DNA recombination-dependent growth factor C
MNRETKRKIEKYDQAAKRSAKKRLEQKAKDAILRGQLLGAEPKMKMTVLDAVNAYITIGKSAEEAAKKVIQLYKSQFDVDITDELLDQMDAKMKELKEDPRKKRT